SSSTTARWPSRSLPLWLSRLPCRRCARGRSRKGPVLVPDTKIECPPRQVWRPRLVAPTVQRLDSQDHWPVSKSTFYILKTVFCRSNSPSRAGLGQAGTRPERTGRLPAMLFSSLLLANSLLRQHKQPRMKVPVGNRSQHALSSTDGSARFSRPKLS